MIFNIAPFCRYRLSSESIMWDKYSIGSPLDPSQTYDTYSFHTEIENNPYIDIELPYKYSINSIVIFLRGKYDDQNFPLALEFKVDDNWVEVANIESKPLLPKLEFNLSFHGVDRIKVLRKGYGCLSFSYLEIMVEDSGNNLSNVAENSSSELATICYTPFYGLGGKLAVMATAIEHGRRTLSKYYFYDWNYYGGAVAGIIKYPREIRGEERQSFYENNKEHLPNDIFDHLVSGSEYRGSIGISSFFPGTINKQKKYLNLISRDQPLNYLDEGVDYDVFLQKIYSRITFCNDVYERVDREILSLGNINFSECMGVHVRHGNGEKYYNKQTQTFGVVPPPVDEILSCIDDNLRRDGSIKNIILATDCMEVYEALQESFSPGLKVTLISNHLQPNGHGTNHNDLTFDPKIKKKILPQLEENLIAITEILILARCHALFGVESYFYQAVVGFSKASPNNIFRFKGYERYCKVQEGLISLHDSEQYLHIYDILVESGIPTDGIFIRRSKEEKFDIFYFNVFIMSFENFDKNIFLDLIKKQRWY